MLRNLLGRLRSQSNIERLPPPIDERQATSNFLCRELETCGVCKRALSSTHRFAKVASVIVEPSENPSIVQLADAIVHRDWQLLTGFNDWNGDRDNLVVYFVDCPDGGGTLVQIYDPVELYESPHIYRKELLDNEETRVLSESIPGERWNPF